MREICPLQRGSTSTVANGRRTVPVRRWGAGRFKCSDGSRGGYSSGTFALARGAHSPFAPREESFRGAKGDNGLLPAKRFI